MRNSQTEQNGVFCQNEPQPACQNEEVTMVQVIENIGAGEGNRTLVISLEGCCSTIELHPHHFAVLLETLSSRKSAPDGGEVGLENVKLPQKLDCLAGNLNPFGPQTGDPASPRRGF
jgi:hypothetical protein